MKLRIDYEDLTDSEIKEIMTNLVKEQDKRFTNKLKQLKCQLKEMRAKINEI